jgi:lipopolysaccharide/colanic/teichoic acid biosynthesis glycosyltransferase
MSQLPDVNKPCYWDIPWLDCINPEKCLLTERQYLVAKRVTDLTVSILTAPIWSLLMGVCALLIKIESPHGPIFFMQERTGKGGRRFRMFKFRTMVPNAAEIEGKLAHLSKLKWPDFKIEDDPRITKVGHILRKTSLDELPQLINVLRGEMSLVGPRPTIFGTDAYQLWQTARLDVTPGMTGLWQITHRAELEFYERARLDILYAERRCFRLDLEILLRTIPAVVRGKGAH